MKAKVTSQNAWDSLERMGEGACEEYSRRGRIKALNMRRNMLELGKITFHRLFGNMSGVFIGVYKVKIKYPAAQNTGMQWVLREPKKKKAPVKKKKVFSALGTFESGHSFLGAV